MPITVKHGSGDIGALLQLALASGAANMPRVPTSPRGGVSRGGGGGGGRRSGGGGGGGGDTALDRAEAELLLLEREPTLREKAEFEGLKAKLRAEAVAPIELEMMEEEQRLQDEGWERKYSAKQKQDITRANESIQRVRTMVARGEVDPTTGQRMINAAMAQRDGINPNLYPPDPSKPPEGQRPGDTGTDDFGNQFTIDSDGNRKIITESRYTPKGLEDAHRRAVQIKQLDMQKSEMAARTALEKERRTQEIKWATEQIPVLSKAEPGFLGTSIGAEKGGVPTSETRLRRDEEVRELSDKFFGPRPGEAVPQQGAAPASAPGTFDKIFEEVKESLTYSKEEHGLPERAAMAQSFLRYAAKQGYNKKTSPKSPAMSQAIREALDIMREYKTQEAR